MRHSIKTLFVAPALVLAAACSKDKPADPSLSNDLSLAAQARSQTTLDSISAAERSGNGTTAARTATAPAPRRTAATTRRRTTSSSSGTSTPAPQREEIHKNTKRDAAIGAAAGAVIGATTSRDKVKGGLIGAAAGAILGGVIGNNVDVQKKKVP